VDEAEPATVFTARQAKEEFRGVKQLFHYTVTFCCIKLSITESDSTPGSSVLRNTSSL
jgi:hypothetical protein